MPAYYVIQADGSKLGPYEPEALRGVAAAGTIQSQSMIQEAVTGDSMPAYAVPFLSEYFPPPPREVPAWAQARIRLAVRVAWAGIVLLVCWIADITHYLFTSPPRSPAAAAVDAFIQRYPAVLLGPGLVCLAIAAAMVRGIRVNLRARLVKEQNSA